MVIYLAGPINGCSDSECKDWRECAKIKIHSAGHQTLDPMRRDYRGIEAECVRAIVEGDKEDIGNSDRILAMCPKPSVGTSMEIMLAWSTKILVGAVVPDKSKASPWLLYHASVHESLDAAIDALLR